MTARLIVLGSANTDYTVVVDRHPTPGETLLGGDVSVATGGKGANQALAAARSGALPVFVGAVGADAGGRALLDALGAGGVDVSTVARVADAPTGVALITVARDGENTIVVAPGANGRIDADAVVATIADLAGPGTVLLSQLEVPLDVVHTAAEAIEQRGGRVVLNLSPAREIPEGLLGVTDPLVVNASEAEAVSGASITDVASAQRAAQGLLDRCHSVVITLGGDGAVWAGADGAGHVAAPRVDVVDTTGAGDAFVGALAAELADGAALQQAVSAGVRSGAAAVQWRGAQPPR
ncbi:ribokinase [Microcella putealis]|uniref:Ribokinase n=1 Tax=Microcella putealis TaxID=337005 RepID=A0A4Q7LS68_9MICO|nr:ribokinase [Microcella putealis]RZS57544.1 ribokinase [Microcella putealis]TQM24611.1 ribokinase [Microcella putealis]